MQKYFRDILFPFLVFVFFFSGSDLFSQESSESFVREISILNCKITRQATILRELEFAESDTFYVREVPQVLEKARQNLLNTNLFNFVDVNPVWGQDSVFFDVEISVIERWYVWPIPLLEIADRNFNAWWKDKDLSRLNYGVLLKWGNFTGRKDLLKVLLRIGHEDKIGLFYELPSFNKRQTLGFHFGISYARQHEIGVEAIGNKLIYFQDDEVYLQKSFETYCRIVYRPLIHQKQHFEINYQNIDLHDELFTEYPSLTQNNLGNLKFLTLSYKFISDHRDYIPYPLKGSYFDIEFRKVGFGLIQPEGVDFFYVKSSLNYYWKLKNRWFYTAGLLTKISNTKFQPYILQRGLGYKEEYLRSYELYVLDGQHYGLFRSNIKFELIPKRVYRFKFIRNEKFGKIFYAVYMNMFFDCAYVEDKYNASFNPLSNKLQYGYGLGIDLVTYYSLVFRVELSRNKLNEYYIFFHLKAPF